jgi:hypothetical protein
MSIARVLFETSNYDKTKSWSSKASVGRTTCPINRQESIQISKCCLVIALQKEKRVNIGELEPPIVSLLVSRIVEHRREHIDLSRCSLSMNRWFIWSNRTYRIDSKSFDNIDVFNWICTKNLMSIAILLLYRYCTESTGIRLSSKNQHRMRTMEKVNWYVAV